MVRYCGQNRSESHHIQDFPVFNGKYSTTCYIEETLQALDDMYGKRALEPIEYLRTLKNVFMHRPYRRMPENGWSLGCLPWDEAATRIATRWADMLAKSVSNFLRFSRK